MSEAFRLKMRSLSLPVFHVLDNRLMEIEQQLGALKTKTPQLFQQSPVVVDVEVADIDLALLADLLRRYGIIPVGIQSPDYADEAQKNNLAVFAARQEAAYVAQKVVRQRTQAKLITKPIRSGQQVYAEGGDLIVLASVSPGSELLADGHIHVYGTLRGRALAGIQGDREARIFCQALEADLLSVAGFYMVSEMIDKYRQEGPQQIYLENDKLKITRVC